MKELKERVVATCAQLNSSGILSPGNYGNISARVPGQEAYLIDSDSVLDEFTTDKIALVSFGGQVLEGRVRETTKGVFDLHSSVYKKRSDVNAIIHTHSPHAASFAIAGKPIPLSTYELEWVCGGAVPLAKFARRGERAMAESVLRVLGKGNAVIMANHGLLALGSDLKMALANALAIEDSARKILYAHLLGKPQPLPP